ncbi:MAG: bifunctional homocysteine S-methyltransferase/methylenetetrahydrofolate reductase [Candidatus Sericytochromatia bacterium]
MSTPLRKRLSAGELIVFDGGTGTMLYNHGVFINKNFEMLNLQQPELVQEIHRQYLAVGAEVIETNTFGANPVKLKAHGLADQVEQINRAGAELAREAAGEQALVAGSIGPLGLRIEPLGPTSYAEACAFFAQQVRPLIAGGVDLFVLETFTQIEELAQAVRAVRAHSDLPILASMTVNDEGRTLLGMPPELFTPFLNGLEVDAIGLNCSVGPKIMFDVIQQMREYTDKPLAAQPNAGHPRVYQDRTIYMCSPDYMASYARKLIKSGVQLIGGCCGTTPEHIQEIARSAKALQPARQHLHAVPAQPKQPVIPDIQPIALAEKSRLAGKLSRGEKVVSIELTPPRGCDPSGILAKAQVLHDHGIDAINLPDGPRASARMSNQILSLLIHQQVGIEPIPHYCCRDRNLLGMQSDLLGLYAGGVHNILLVTGDPPKLGDYPDATAVFDVDAIGLTNIVHGLNHGYDLGRNPLNQPTGYLIGVGLNPVAVDPELEIRRFFYKVEAGAEYAITQPIFDVDCFRRFLARIDSHRIPILAGIWPLASYRNAEFMRNEVPGVVIPDAIMERMCAAEERGEGKQEGIRIAQEMVAALKDEIQGIQVSAPFGRLEPALQVVVALR